MLVKVREVLILYTDFSVSAGMSSPVSFKSQGLHLIREAQEGKKNRQNLRIKLLLFVQVLKINTLQAEALRSS